MKIQCDVCNKIEASVFCSADEAALCDVCDSRVHHANKLASKHHRFSLLNPSSSKDTPRCDICQERRAFQFCREDRAILCRECDLSIHTANEYTQKHNRFLLTGVKLSSTSSIFSPSSSTKTNTTITSSSNGYDVSIDSRSTNNATMNNSPHQQQPSMKKKPKSVPDSFSSGFGDQIQINSSKQSSKGGGGGGGVDYFNQPTPSAAGSTSSISEYLIEMLPGWQVEDLLDSSSAPSNGFCKNDDLLLPFFDTNFEANLVNFATDDLTLWVPEISAPPPPPASHPHPPLMAEQKNVLYKELKEVITNNPNSKVMNRRWRDHSLTVPQISPPSNKRSRTLW